MSVIVIWVDGLNYTFSSIEEAEEFCDKYIFPRTAADEFPMEVDDERFLEGPD